MKHRLIATSLATVALAGCGPSLGSYEVTDVQQVDVVPETEDFVMPGKSGEFGPFLQIDLRSDFDLAADVVGDTYALKIDCGMSGKEDRMIFGPFAAGDPPTELYDSRPSVKRDAQGLARYVVFLPVTTDDRQGHSGAAMQPGYDVVAVPGDLCLKIIQTGYFITESRSDTIRIPATAVQNAIAP